MVQLEKLREAIEKLKQAEEVVDIKHLVKTYKKIVAFN